MNAQAKLTSLQQALYQFVAEKAETESGASFQKFAFPGTVNDEHLVASAAFNQPGTTLNLSLPEWSNKAFISITDEHVESFAELVASFNAESETNDALSIGYAEKLDIPALNAVGWHGIAMVKPNTLIENFPDQATIVGEDYEFILVVLITAQEFQLWRKKGAQALCDELEKKNRDLITFEQNKRLNTGVQSQKKEQIVQQRSKSFEQSHSGTHQSQTAAQESHPMPKGPAHMKSESIKAQAPMTKPLKTPPAAMASAHALGMHPSINTQAAMPGYQMPAMPYVPGAPQSIAPLFPAAQPHSATGDIPTDPLRINMGVEPCQEFLDGNLRALNVGKVQAVNPSQPIQAAAAQALQPASIPKKESVPASSPAPNNKPSPSVQTQPAPSVTANSISPNTQTASQRSSAQSITPNAAPAPTPVSVQPSDRTQTQTLTQSPERTIETATKEPAWDESDSIDALSETLGTNGTLSNTKSRLFNSDHSRKPLNIDYESIAFDPQELVLDEVQFVQNMQAPTPKQKNSLHIIGITALGGVLMAGGIITTMFVMDTQTPMLSAVPAVLALGGLGALVSAFKDALSIGLKKTPQTLGNDANPTL